MARHKHLNIKIRQGLVKTLAVRVALSTLFGGLAYAGVVVWGGWWAMKSNMMFVSNK
ncbi:hypothetical protein [Alloscardovia criceti]|uniref:hypothetical protein n=1 Tax=Alloscardovia criceti TaxID=356828 RepID=UPI0012EA1BD7|nr:hypothetical protein [Alloscardovia criceti]